MVRGVVLFLFMVGATVTGCFGQDESGPSTPPATPGNPGLEETPRIGFVKVVDGLERPVFVTDTGDGSGRLFVVEQAGRILVVSNGTLASTPLLDIRDRVGSGGYEQGLLGLAFYPDLGQRAQFIVDYTDKQGDTVISRFRLDSAKANLGLVATEEVLFRIDQPAANHNGGMVAFGPDGHLYIAMGDGGLSNDAFQNGQNPFTALGALLRIDVGRATGYAIPPDNPFAGGPQDERIWAWGLRNPWRFSFDSATGDLYIGDVGQNRVEEVDFQPASSSGGENYGWPIYEGSQSNNPGVTLSDAVFPVAEYSLVDTSHCAVTGGYVYRGSAVPGLVGHYVFGDFCSGTIWALKNESGTWRVSEIAKTAFQIASFGEDEGRELYVVDHAGSVQRIVAAGA